MEATKSSDSIDQVKIEYDDERVRCGGAVFTPSMNELRVTFDGNERQSRTLVYDLASVPFNTACRLYDAENRPTWFLVCNRYGTLFVRHGSVPPGRYHALRVKNRPTRVSLCNPRYGSSPMPTTAFHPNPEIPIYVVLNQDRVTIGLAQGGVRTFRADVPLKKLSAGLPYVPRDTHGHPLPLRLRRPLLAALVNVNRVDVEWLD